MMTGRPRRWRKRLLWFVAIAVVARLLLALAMPWLVDLGAAAIGCTAHYRSASLSLFGLSLQVQDLEVHDAARRDEAPLLAAKDVTADLSTWDLIRGKFVVVDAAVSGGRVVLRRQADGTLQLPAALQASPAASAAETTAPAAATAPTTGTPSLALPFCITAARIHDLRVLLHDESTSPVRDVEAIVDVDVNEVGQQDRPGNLRIRVHSPGLLDHLQAQASITAAIDRLALQWQVVVRGLQVSELRLSAVAHAAFDNARRADFELGGSLTAAPSHSSVTPFAGTAELHARVVLDAIERARLRATVGPTTLEGNQFVLPFHTELYGSQIVERLDLANGRIEVGPDRLGLAAALDCRGLTLRRLTTFLRERGISIVESGVDATARLSAEIAPRDGGKLTARLHGLSLRHADEGIELRAVNVLDVALVPAGIDIGAIEIEGPAVTVAREADGTIAVAGLRFYANTSPAATTEPEAEPVAVSAPKPRPQVALHRLAWRGANFRFTDGTLPGSPTLVLADLNLLAEEWNFGADLPTGHAALSLRLPGSVEELRADLRLQQATEGATAELQLDAKGLTARELGPWLAPLGIAPQLQDATLGLTATTSVAIAAGTTTISGQLANLRLQDRDRLLVGLRNAELTRLVAGGEQLDLGALRLDEPRVVIDQEADGAWTIAGLRFRPAPPPVDPGQPAEPALPPTTSPKTTLPWRSGPVKVQGAQIAWHDVRRTPQPLSLRLDADVGPRRGDGSPMTFAATLQLERAIEALELRGEVVADGEALQLGAELSSRGIRGNGLATLLPDDLTATLVEGSLHARLSAQTRTLPSGTTLDLVVSEVRLSDRGEELAAIDRLELHAPQLGQTLLHVQSLRVQGLRATAAQTEAGLQVPGLLLRNPTEAASLANAAAPKSSNSNQPSPLARGASAAVGMPALRLDELDVQCERIVLVDRRGEAGSTNTTPLALAAHLQLQQPWATAPELAESPPVSLLVTASVAPLCAAVRIELQVQPFHLAPWVELDLRAEGLDPTAIANFSPQLAERLGGTTTDATVRAKLYGSLELRRRDPTRFDFSKPFGAHLLVEGLDVRETGSSDPLATIAAVDVQVRAIDPRTGDVLLKSVDIDTPRLRATRTAAGLEVAGLLLRDTPAAANPANPPPPPAQSGAPEPEFAVDRLRIQGLGFDFRDGTTTPVTHLPIHDLDLDLQQFSTRIFTSPRPFAFELNVHGGDVELTRRVLRSSIAAGMVGSTTNALLFNRDQHQVEQRPLFQDLAVTGQMQVYPLPKGSFRLDLTSFEMPAIRGLASRGDVIVNDGLLDLSVVAQMGAGAGTKVKSGITFTWLSMSEPPNGPISTYLKLPAPLDTVLFLLRNDADEQRLPLQVHLPANGVSPNAIAEAAIEALTLAIGDAVARSPFRVAGVVTNLFDLGRQRPDLGDPVPLDCRPGDSQPDLANLADLLATTRDDPQIKFVLTHDLGKGDLDRTTALANPPPEVVRAAIDRLRARRLDLLNTRTSIAAETAAQFAAARHDALTVLARLEAIDADLGALDATLDEALAMLDGNTTRDRNRNARKAAVGLANLRLELVREELERRLPRGAADRIEVRPARAIAADGLDGGGRVVITPRQRAPATDQRR